jgi:hypothetical protein
VRFTKGKLIAAAVAAVLAAVGVLVPEAHAAISALLSLVSP